MRYFDNFQGVSKKYAELVKGKLSHHGDVDLTKYYIVSQEIIQYRMSQTEGRWSVQVSLALPLHITACGHRMADRKWKEGKQQPSMLLGSAVPGISLVSFYFLWAILCPQAVLKNYREVALSDPRMPNRRSRFLRHKEKGPLLSCPLLHRYRELRFQ